MTPANVPQIRFGEIALCLSGGGYRAASYSFGTLDMLDEMDLLRDVKLFSTASGGTFTGLTYAAWRGEDKTFGQFYDDFYNFLLNTNAIQKALDDLYTAPSPSGSTDLSLIRAAAEEYRDGLFRDRTFQSLLEGVGTDKPFKELIFNATEFRMGNSFRFRASDDPDVFIGNQVFAVPREVAGEIRLADIVAASSCFPAAFEPIRFPEDFWWTGNLEDVRAELEKDVKNPVTGKIYRNGFKDKQGNFVSLPLMDGGIYDNQGIASAVLADYKQTFDLFLISDTSPRNDDMLNFPTTDARRGWFTINTLFWAAVALFIAAVINVVLLAYYFFTALDARRASWFELTLLYIAPVFFSLAVAGLLLWIYGLFRPHRTITISGATFELWDIVKKLAIPDFIELVKARFSSLATMASDVLLKRIRQLQFTGIMDDAKRGKLVSFNLIYDLNPTVPRTDLWKLAPDLEPTAEMVEISKTAEAVATTLWVNKKDLDTLIVCGQITTCFSLLKYLWRKWQAEENAKASPTIVVPKPDNPASPYYEIYQKLLAKWLELKADPQSSLNRKRV